MRKVFTISLFCILLNPAFSQHEERVDKNTFIDSAMKVIRMQNLKGWVATKHGTRIVLSKTDSIFVATSIGEYKPEKLSKDFASVKYKYQLFIDFTEKELNFGHELHKIVNDSLDKLIKSFTKKKYERGEYYTNLEAIELLQKMKIRDNTSVNYFDIRFSDNLADNWIPYERNDIKYFPAEPPSHFQKNVEELKRKITEMLVAWGI